MGSAKPVTDKERERVRQLHAEGKGRNEIAKILGRGGRTVSDIAQGLGLSFGRAAEVRQATEVRQADLADRRAALAQRLQDVAERELEKVNKPHLYFEWGGKDHTYAQKLADEPHPSDKRALMGVVATAIDRSLKLAPAEQDTEGLAAVDAWLKGMMGGS
ncbi:helix-turn-helix domain-containing protein [Streptomyces sp. NPDC002952]|uniref:helix-turn-helix domain-containing protein n=1 Tax=Streptomyces sp. NPDC002952 TaxID=3364673 RepID=UPI0036D11B0F